MAEYRRQQRLPSRKNDTKCRECDQLLSETTRCDDVNFKTFKSEFETLTDPSLLATYADGCGENSVDFPTHKITDYFFHDTHTHFVSLDSGLIEKGNEIYVTGIVKRIDDEDSSCLGGFPTQNIGPINEWWITGFDGGTEVILGVDSCSASYVLMKPSQSYARIMQKMFDKLYLSKYVIEYAVHHLDASYEEMIAYIAEKSSNRYNEESLLSNGDFVLSQIISFDEAAELGDPLILESQCVQDLLTLIGNKTKQKNLIDRNSVMSYRHIARKDVRRLADSDTYATTTPLVRTFFETMFKEAIEKIGESPAKESTEPSTSKRKRLKQGIGVGQKIRLPSEPLHEDPVGAAYYNQVIIDDEKYCAGDFVVLDSRYGIGRIMFVVQSSTNETSAHVQWLCHGHSTVLNETCDHRYVFMLPECGNVKLCQILRKVTVLFNIHSEECEAFDQYVCNKMYSFDDGSFSNIPDKLSSCPANLFCVICETLKTERKASELRLENLIHESDTSKSYSSFYWRKDHYKLSDCILLRPNTFECPIRVISRAIEDEEDYDDEIFTEKYRKNSSDMRGSFADSPPLPQVAHIKKILISTEDPMDLRIKVIKLFRPEDVLTPEEARLRDINELFLTEQTTIISLKDVISTFPVYFSEEPPPNDQSENFFYFRYLYKNASAKPSLPDKDLVKTFRMYESHVHDLVKLRSLDLFAGCGGLALGFENAGVSETKWAIEKDASAAASFHANFPKAVVWQDDANHILKALINGHKDYMGNPLPKKCEVELLLAGPPCQGFSGMNRFSSRQYSLFKNSLMVTLLSYVDYLRPAFVVIENVRNFVLFKNSMVLKLTLSCLLEMNYQVRFGILQAGCYGVPQSRRRFVVFAAAANKELPHFPHPSHAFSDRSCQISVNIDGKRYAPKFNFHSAPFRAMTVRDAISDLPPTTNECRQEYQTEPQSHYQRLMRQSNYNNLTGHICKPVTALTQARINHIPLKPGSDWRDLPNIRVPLPDGTIVNKLIYHFEDPKFESCNEQRLRGVCTCITGAICDGSKFRQENTLIPWCLVHTANRQYQWAGLYGRLDWDGFFPTVCTNPEPISKQGRVIHPSANRIVSVRECARAQSFPDDFIFSGNVSECHKQIGNAVPPILSFALGRQFSKTVTRI